MATRLITEEEYENKTGTDLAVLQSIEKAYLSNNPEKIKRNNAASLKWFSQYVPRSFNRTRTARMFMDRSMWRNKVIVGNMYFVQYSALHDDKLPFWDKFPLIFPFNQSTSKAGDKLVHAINMHYLSPALRYRAMTVLLKMRNEQRYREKTKLNISWAVLSSAAESDLFKHAVKTYRVDHYQSVFVKIPSQAWELTLFLPLARIVRGSNKEMWKL